MYTRIFYLFLSLFLLNQANVSAQAIINNHELVILSDTIFKGDSLKSKFVIYQDKRIDTLLEQNRLANSKIKGFYGFRIQIYSKSSIDSSVKQAEDYKKAFEERFPELKVYLNYFDPDFKIRVGNFRDKIEAEAILRKIKQYYPDCYTVRTLISFKELLISTRADALRDTLNFRDSIRRRDSLIMPMDTLKINQTLNNNTNE